MEALGQTHQRGGAAPAYGSLLLKTGQTTQYRSELDDGYYEKGVAKSYTVNTAGAQSGTTNVTLTHVSIASISFTASTRTIARANCFGSFVAGGGETIVVTGSTSNNGTYTTASATTGTVVVNETLNDEAADAGKTITITKTEAISNNTVLDNNTGLVWTRYNPIVLGLAGKLPTTVAANVKASIFTYATAANAVSLGGYTDWRVPNIYELLSITDFEAATAVPDTTAFPSVLANYYLTSTSQVNVTTSMYAVRFDVGVTAVIGAESPYYILLVRGG